jgi:glyoxylase I family protein
MANEKIKGAGFHHAALEASDFDKTMKFYQEVLGCKLVRSWGEGKGRAAMLDIGDGGLLEIFAKGTSEPEQHAKWVHFAFRVDDSEAAFQTAVAAGAPPKMEPKDVVIASDPPYPAKVSFVYGPDGESIEFFQVK